MKALHIARYGRFPQLIDLPLPSLQKNTLLIKMKYAPINPSDINFFQGLYGIRKQATPIVGFQGSGVIIDTENNIHKKLIGRTVSVLANQNNGTYSTHIASSPQQLIIWPEQSHFSHQNTLKEISMSWINPISCIGLASYATKYNYETVILSAATSQLSKMLIKYIKKKTPSTKIIGFSRSQKHDDQLKSMGINEISRIDNVKRIQDIKSSEKRSLFLDCIGGQFASKMFNSLPSGSMMVSYGRLSKQPLNNIDLGELYFGNKKIQGFWLNTLLREASSEQVENMKKQVIQNHKQIFQQRVRKVYAKQSFMQALRQSIRNASEGKILLSL